MLVVTGVVIMKNRKTCIFHIKRSPILVRNKDNLLFIEILLHCNHLVRHRKKWYWRNRYLQIIKCLPSNVFRYSYKIWCKNITPQILKVQVKLPQTAFGQDLIHIRQENISFLTHLIFDHASNCETYKNWHIYQNNKLKLDTFFVCV